jgi:hypothetical protein
MKYIIQRRGIKTIEVKNKLRVIKGKLKEAVK